MLLARLFTSTATAVPGIILRLTAKLGSPSSLPGTQSVPGALPASFSRSIAKHRPPYASNTEKDALPSILMGDPKIAPQFVDDASTADVIPFS